MYLDQWTIRQLWVRVQALPPDAPLFRAQIAAAEKAEADQKTADLHDVGRRFGKEW